MKASARYHLNATRSTATATECDRGVARPRSWHVAQRLEPALGDCLRLFASDALASPNNPTRHNHGLVWQWQGREAQRIPERRSLQVLGSQGCLFCLPGCGGSRRRGNRRLKVRRAEKVLRAELRKELGEPLSLATRECFCVAI